MFFIKLSLLMFIAVFYSGCSSFDYLGFEKKEKKLEGERISILDSNDLIKDKELFKDDDIVIPEIIVIKEWKQKDLFSTHQLLNLSGPSNFKNIKSFSIGKGEGKASRILAQPIVNDNKIFVLDAESTVRVFSLDKNKLIWKKKLIPSDESKKSSIGGGIAVDKNNVYVTTAYGQIIAMEKKSGNIIWDKDIGVPIRSSPTIIDNKIIILTINNRLLVLKLEDGSELWRHETSASLTTMMTSASVAADSELVIAPYSNGEVHALRLDNGITAWSDSLVDVGKIDSSNALTDIDASPVISNNLIVVASIFGKVAAIDRRSGLRVWEQNISIYETPLVLGNVIYLISENNEVICLDKNTGSLRWVTSLNEKYQNNAKDRWFSPLLINSKLIVIGGKKLIIKINPLDGSIEESKNLPGYPASGAVSAMGKLFILTRSSKLITIY